MSAITKGRITGSRLALAIHLGLFASACQVQAAEAPAGASQPATLMFDIAAQPLGSAVLRFADQAGLQVLFDSQRLQGLSSTALKGSFSVHEGLGRLLGAAPVEYRFTGARQVTLTRVEQPANAALALATTTITGQHRNDWVYSSPRSVSVVGREQLDRNPPRHAAEMLEEAPGVYSAVSQQDPGLSVNIRGIQDYGRVNMSVDGMRQNYQQSGHQQRNGTLYVDPELLSEVVIEKGATSTMGGAGVIGGVANFRTVEAADLLKDGKQIGGRIRVTTGLGGLSNGTHFIGSSAFAVGTDVWDMLVAASERHLGDYDPGTQGSIGDLRTGTAFIPASQDRIKNTQVAYSGSVMRSRLLKLGLNLPADQRLQLSYLLTEVDYDDVNMMTAEKPQLWEKLGSSNVKAQNLALDYSYTPDNPLIDFKAKLYAVDTRNDQSTLARGRTPGYDVTYQTDTYGVQAQNTSTFALSELSVLKANYGLEFFYDKVRPDSNQPVEAGSAVEASALESITPKGDRAMGSLFGRLDYDYDDWLNLNAGLRYDRYRLRGETGLNTRTFIIGTTRQIGVPVAYDVDREEGHFSPTFGLSIKPGVDWLQLFATYGKGWRPPAVTETLVSGRPHGGGSESILPNPYLKPEKSTAWEVGFNVLKQDLLLEGDRVGVKVSYFNTRVDDFSYMALGVQPPGYGIANIGNAAYVNNLETTRFRGLEYQLDYDAGFAYGQVNYTRMLGSNKFCSNTAWLGGVTKIQSRPGNRRPVDAMVPDDVANAAVGCNAILGSSEHMPMDRGTATLGARFFERKLDVGVRARYSAGYYVKGGVGVTTSQTGVYPADWKPYTVYDLYSSYRATDQLTLRLAMENVTDRAYLVPLGDVLAFTLGRGRTLQGTVEYQF
ncbi:TonB-dependent hemoglobin/transferrin/lactoferrin family receptor [Pseudomonas sp. CBSPBW29]|uniref:TonB-dependent receptor n=1 Tax=Pseudomonas TaxID=286 RepID=UPI0021ABB46C|nr:MULTISPECIES: TonB-dependent receptor [unclassified Pseudomonas]WEL41307.1 TonB-dependent hemoglobin/transferrin/lactoferrin family receptor [Pseudomonas sp. CBSPBW29]WEL62368.1 TonB-dependent hemoglobin/transferrin/lactoferrin family receptor [Pseudomonas sp. CBSPGW29]WEL71560.1 TonB-dependent hemoglobin/transferrin/lactoferrin family receptor [Pseudomonas sp. CBSPCGW29]WEL78471.1 TonB-dependent hemoglobin/transferrin/lactoferrin family receptor [Pseudomonas sp. CBSPAW29]WEL82895.1 TonB-de